MNMKILVEKAYADNDNTPIILICHSMGSPNMLYFLNRQKQAWKDKYIRALVTLAGVWGGTVRAMKVFAVGEYSRHLVFDMLSCIFILIQVIIWELG